jgi:hypothetical protein
MDGLYDTDVVEWAERQARLLRRLWAGEKVNEQLDWANIIDEVETVGRSEFGAVESLLTLAFLHDLKAAAWPNSRDVEHWQAEARLFRRQARRKFTPSMRSKIDLNGLYEDAVAGLPLTMYGQAPQPIIAACPVTLNELLAGRD